MNPIPDDLFGDVDRELPLALLPVRLEVRFGSRPLSADLPALKMPVLRVRIYPDDISIDDHNVDLNQAEIAAGAVYWSAVATPADTPVIAERAAQAAWERLCQSVKPYRAAYVADQTQHDYDHPPRRGVLAATAELLPDRWLVTGWVGEARAFATIGGAIRKPLAVGPSQDADLRLSLDPHGDTPHDAATKWLADYAEAEAVGMAVTIDLSSFDAAGNETASIAKTNRISRLLVFGLREQLNDGGAEAEAAALQDLIGRHKAVHGAKFLLQGTPTNNLRGQRAAWQSRPDPAAVRAAAPPAPMPAPADLLRGGGNNAQVAAAALGLPAGAFADLDSGEHNEQRPARLMNDALFPVTWGEMIGTLLLPKAIDATEDKSAIDGLSEAYGFGRRHFRDYVRGRGPLPTMLLGRQPYGILPVTDPGRWQRQADEPATLGKLASLLARVRPFWTYAAQNAPALPSELSDVDVASKRLIEIMGLGPVPHPSGYGMRKVSGPLAALKYYSSEPHPWVIVGEEQLTDAGKADLADRTQAQIYRMLLGQIPALPKRARFFDLDIGQRSLLTIPTVDTEAGKTPRDYLPWLATYHPGATGFDLVPEVPPGDDLLFQLLIRSLLQANEQAAFAAIRKAAGWDKIYTEIIARPVELSQLSAGAALSTAAVFATPIRDVMATNNLGIPAAEFADANLMRVVADRDLLGRFGGIEMVGDPLTAAFIDTRTAIEGLASETLEATDFERLLGESLATCGTRVDAWITSIATARLDLLRRRRPRGLRIGAYGWLVNLPLYRDPAASLEDLPGRYADQPAPVAPRRQVGWVHAPSIVHAQTAAILRSAELSHGDDAGSSVARIDLTSARVRAATQLLDAVHNGQPLGAVLGYRLERSMQDQGLARLIADLRAAYPQRSVPMSDGAAEQVAPHDVVDGELLWSAWHAAKNGGAALPNSAQAILAQIEPLIEELDGAIEAVSDLLLAEGVHNIVRGNHARAAATLNAIAYGEPLPTDLDVVRSPRNGNSLTHRVVLLLPNGDAGIAGWTDAAPRARLTLELEQWARRLLGRPERWVAEVFAPGSAQAPVSIKLSELSGLCALDVINEATGAAAAQSPLADRLVAQAGMPGGRVRQPSGELPAGSLGWDQLTALAGAARDVLSTSRPLTGQHLADPDGNVVPTAGLAKDIDKVRLRLDSTAAAFVQASANLDAAIAQQPPDVAALSAGLAALVGFSLPGTSQPAGLDVAKLTERAIAVRASAQKILTVINAPPVPENTAQSPIDDLVERARLLLGPTTILTFDVGASPQLLPDSAPAGTDRPDPDEWLRRSGRVRPLVAAINDLRNFARALDGPALAARVAQLPARPDDSWLAGRLRSRAIDPADLDKANRLREFERWSGPRAHLVLLADGEALPGRTTGLVLDEWTEVIPAATQTTGISFYYDAPNARAPQSILLAVHPDPDNGNQPWSWPMLEAMLADTLDLASLRTVELPQLAPTAVDEYLPAIYARDGMGSTVPLEQVASNLFGKLTDTAHWRSANLDVLKNG